MREQYRRRGDRLHERRMQPRAGGAQEAFGGKTTLNPEPYPCSSRGLYFHTSMHVPRTQSQLEETGTAAARVSSAIGPYPTLGRQCRDARKI